MSAHRYRPALSRSLVAGLWLLALVAAPAGLMLVSQPAQAACAALPTSKGTTTTTVTIPSTGSYRVWSRIYSPSAGANSFYLQIADANACQITVGNASIPAGALTWVDYQNGNTSSKINVTLSAGSHTIVMAGLEDNVEVDKILLLNDTSCTPTGDGANCQVSATPTPTATPTPPPGGGGTNPTPSPTPTPVVLPPSGQSAPPVTVAGKVNITPSLPAGSTNVKYYVDGKEVASSELDTTKLADGTHTVEARAVDADGKTVVSKSEIVVKNKKTVQEQLAAGLRTATPYLLGLAVITALGLVYWFGAPQVGLSHNPLQWSKGPAASPSTTPGPVSEPVARNPQPGIIFPDPPATPSETEPKGPQPPSV